ncbi:MAG: LSU ribosomal protein L4p (L1e), partial [uncultured Gemmatimonadetes bacterium]
GNCTLFQRRRRAGRGVPAPRGAFRRHRQRGRPPCGDQGAPGQQAPGQRQHQDARRRFRREPQAVAPEGHRPGPPGHHAGAALARRRHRLRAAPAFVPAGRAAQGQGAGPPLGVQPARQQRRDHGHRALRLRRAEDPRGGVAAGPHGRRRRQARPGAHARQQRNGVPLVPQPAERRGASLHAGVAVRRDEGAPGDHRAGSSRGGARRPGGGGTCV